VRVASNIEAIWTEAGHMLGSASIQLIVQEDGKEKKVVFSGDLGQRGLSLTRNYQPFDSCDMVFMESTYGGRDHRDFRQTVDEFVGIVQQASKTGGKILIPTFAVGRAQLLIVLLAWMFRTKKVKPFPVYLDSPMAIDATLIYAKYKELFSDELKRFIKVRPIKEDMKVLQASSTPDESRAINSVAGTCLVMAGAGMCNAGRILHHLKQNLWKPETHVMIVGYQSHGSLGRQLVEGAELVRIHGEKVAVAAEVHTLGGFSAHAGQADSLHWFSALAPGKPRVVLTRGEDEPRVALAKKIQQQFKLPSRLPAMGEVIEL
jgi:metallo-beta-lactamase family protein